MNNGLVGLVGFPDAAIPILRSHIAGLTLANATASSQVLTISAGVAIDSTNAVAMSTSGTYTKTMGQSFQPGARVSGSPSGLLAPSLSLTSTTWYHVYSISLATGPDFYADTSATAANAPPGTLGFRRIGSIRTDTALNVTAFIQDGDYFQWSSIPAVDVSTSNPGTSAVTAAFSVPTGVSVLAQLIWNLVNSAGAGNASMLVTDLAVTDDAPSSSKAQISSVVSAAGGAGSVNAEILIRTNTSGQVRYRLNASSASVSVNAYTKGWFDTRGRFV